MKKVRNSLVETSAVPPAISFSVPKHNEHFVALTVGSPLFTSAYIRMEAIRKWVCEGIEFAELAEQCTTASEALTQWGHTYGRKPKLAVDMMAWLLRANIGFGDEDVHEFAVQVATKAYELLLAFDDRLASRTNNTCGCRIGGMRLEPDFNNLIAELGEFRRRFLTNVVDCPINDFLNFSSESGRGRRMIRAMEGDEDLSGPLIHASTLDSVTCKDCRKIGDQIIAMEQPSAMSLLHVDNSYDKLCEATGNPHMKIRSAASFKPKKPAGPTPPANSLGSP